MACPLHQPEATRLSYDPLDDFGLDEVFCSLHTLDLGLRSSDNQANNQASKDPLVMLHNIVDPLFLQFTPIHHRYNPGGSNSLCSFPSRHSYFSFLPIRFSIAKHSFIIVFATARVFFVLFPSGLCPFFYCSPQRVEPRSIALTGNIPNVFISCVLFFRVAAN